MQAASTTSAGAGVTAGFEIDGNTDVNGTGADWATTGARTTDPVRKDDATNFTGGSKEFQNPSDWVQGTGTATDQGDISDVYSHFVSDGQSWAFLGFRRIAESGTMTFMVELNQKPNLPQETGDTVKFRPDRTVNDLLLRFEQDGSGAFRLSAAYKWTESASGTFADGCFPVPGYTTPSAYCPTSTAGAGVDGATGEEKLFAEAAVNLSSFYAVGDCRGAFGTMNVRSFAGNDEKSSLLDFIGGISISVPPTCGKLVIEKRDQFDRLVPGATFEVTKNPVPGVTGAAADKLVVKDGAAPGIDTVADGIVTIDPSKPGTYTVKETATPAGYAPDTTVHTGVVVGSSGTSVATVEFTNKLYFEPLEVTNKASGSYGLEYDWKVHKTVVGKASKTIEESETTAFDYQVELEALPEGQPSNKKVGGKVTVTNPNPALTHPAMRATIGIGGDLPCRFLPSDDAVDVDPDTTGIQVDVGATGATYDYSCDPGSAPLVSGDTTATVSWDQGTYPQAGAHPGSADATTTYAITVQPKIDERASVTDAFDGRPARPIGAASYLWSDVWKAPDHRVVVATYSSPAVGGTAGACRDYTNLARVDEWDTDDSDTSEQTVNLCVDLDDLEVTKTANPAFARDYDWKIAKSVKGDASQTVDEGAKASFEYDVVVTPSISGDGQFVVTGKITVKNPNETTISGVTLTDSLPGGECTISGAAGKVSIPKGTTPFDYSCVLPDATRATTGINTATATWDTSAYYGTSGTASGQGGFDFAEATPTVTDATATVTDTQIDLDGTSPDGVVVRAADGPRTFTYSKDFDGVPGKCTTYDNTAKVVATDSKDADSDSETVEVCVDLDDLVVTKTAKPAFARDYDWKIAKSVMGDASQTVDEGGKASFEYDVVVTPSISGDGQFVVSGVITVTNPNTTTISGVQLTDSLPGGECTIAGAAAKVSIPKGPTPFDYTCVLPDATATTTGTNTATATWDKAAYLGTTGTGSGEAGFDFADAKPSVTDATATVTDTQVVLPGGTADGVVVKASDGPRTFTYTKEFDGVPGECTTYDNTAKAVATDSKDADSDSESVEVCVDLDDLIVTKTAKPAFARDYDWTIEKSVDSSSRTVDEGTKGSFEYDVVVTPSIAAEGQFVVTGVITVDNPNETTISGVQLADSMPGGQCTIDTPAGALSIGSGESTTYAYSCVLPDATATTTGTNTATATWDKTAYLGTSGSASGSAAFDFANAKVAVTDATATVTDTQVDLDGTSPDGVVVEASDGPRTFTYTREFDGVPGTCTTYDNTAKVVATDSKDADSDSETVEVCVDLDDLVVTKTAKPAFARDYDWTIEKSVKGGSSQTVPQGTPASFAYDVVVTPSAAQDAAFVVTGVITVDNPNETTISGVQLADSLPGGQCTVDTPAGPLSIASGESTYAYSCVLPDATATTKGTNTATATWDKAAFYGTSGTASGQAGFDLADAKPTVTDATATVTDSQVLLGDVPGGAVVTATDGPKTFTYTKAFDGEPGECTTYDNTATVVAADSKDVDSDDATVEVCVEKPLQLAPTATADLVRDHAWSITKVADATQRTADANGNATFTYTVTARAGARTESGWRLQGEVAITNPNQYADGDIVADVTASSDLGGGAVCTVTGGDDVVVTADDSATLPIACTFASKPAGSGTVSVTATWDPAGEATSTSVTESTEPITFVVRSETNKTVQVVDDKTVAGQRVVLDPALTWEAGLVRSYTYSLTLAGGAPGACRSWTNTATIDQPVGTDPTASASVLVCTPAVPPPPVVPPVAPPVAPEVLPEQAFGKAVGSVRASCQGTVRAKLANRSGETVVYQLRVGRKVHKIAVKSLAKKRFVTKGQPRAKVTLKVGSTRLDTLRIPALCAAPEVLPDTGLRATSR